MKKTLKNLGIFLIIVICSGMIVGSIYYKKNYPLQEFDQILFYLLNGIEHTSEDLVGNIVNICIKPVIILTIILTLLIVKTKKYVKANVKTRNKEFEIQLFPIKITSNHRKITISVIIAITIILTIILFGIGKYVANRFQETQIYEEYYVDGKTVDITFPEEKKNLIIIVMESMENTMLTEENGGEWEYSLIPELETLALENVNFSNTEKLGGGYHTFGTCFTAGGLVAETAGIQVVTAAVFNNSNQYYGKGEYLANAYTLVDILKEQGYNLHQIFYILHLF